MVKSSSWFSFETWNFNIYGMLGHHIGAFGHWLSMCILWFEAQSTCIFQVHPKYFDICWIRVHLKSYTTAPQLSTQVLFWPGLQDRIPSYVFLIVLLFGIISPWGHLRRITSVMLYTSWLKSEVNISDNRLSVEMISQQWQQNSWYNQDSVTSCATVKEHDHLMHQHGQCIYTYLNPILPTFYRETLNLVYVFGVTGHARIQLLGMRLQMETTPHYLVMIREAINSRCVKSTTAASLRQNKHAALERDNV